jgi:hypothetical protein
MEGRRVESLALDQRLGDRVERGAPARRRARKPRASS